MMKNIIGFTLISFFLFTTSLQAGILDSLLKSVTGESTSESGLSDSTIISGLKEALTISAEKAVNSVSNTDGFYKNPLIKIPAPEKIQKIADVLRKMGFSQIVDDFELSMNRAAETAAPKATSIFVDSIKEMSFEDARQILNGGDTAATEYFKEKTSDRLYDTLKPIISERMDKVNATRNYKEMLSKYMTVIPFASSQSLDLDDYVTSKGLDGLFLMMAEQEKKIRNDPVERSTDLLRKVFGKS